MIAAFTAFIARYALVGSLILAGLGWAAAGVQAVRLAGTKTSLAGTKTSLAKEQKDRSDERAAAEKSARLDSETYRREEQLRAAEHQKALDDKEALLVGMRADIAVRDAAAGRLQERVTALVAAARATARDSQVAQPSPPADDAAGMLADVLGRCVARVRLLATVADERGAAGATCERLYDSLSTSTD